VWLPVMITVVISTVVCGAGFAYNDAPPMPELNIPDWIYHALFVSIAALLAWLPFTKPFAILRQRHRYLINILLFLIPPLYLLFLGVLSIAAMIAADI